MGMAFTHCHCHYFAVFAAIYRVLAVFAVFGHIDPL